MKYQLNLVTPPAVDVISVTDAKDYLRIDNSVEDERILTMIKAATLKLEQYLSLKFINQVWDIYIDNFPMSNRSAWWDGVRDVSVKEIVGLSPNITFPFGRAFSFDQFHTFADDGVAVVENLSNYVFDSVGYNTRVGLKLGGVWPQTVLRPNNGIKFRFTFGFGTSKDDVPDDIKMAIYEYIAHMYENRGDQNEMKIPPHILTLVDNYKRYKVGC